MISVVENVQIILLLINKYIIYHELSLFAQKNAIFIRVLFHIQLFIKFQCLYAHLKYYINLRNIEIVIFEISRKF